MDRFGQKVRQSRLRWHGEVKCRNDDSVGRNVLQMQLLGKRKRGKPKRRYLEEQRGGIWKT